MITKKPTILDVFRRLPNAELMELTEIWRFITEVLVCIFRAHHDMLSDCEYSHDRSFGVCNNGTMSSCGVGLAY